MTKYEHYCNLLDNNTGDPLNLSDLEVYTAKEYLALLNGKRLRGYIIEGLQKCNYNKSICYQLADNVDKDLSNKLNSFKVYATYEWSCYYVCTFALDDTIVKDSGRTYVSFFASEAQKQRQNIALMYWRIGMSEQTPELVKQAIASYDEIAFGTERRLIAAFYWAKDNRDLLIKHLTKFLSLEGITITDVGICGNLADCMDSNCFNHSYTFVSLFSINFPNRQANWSFPIDRKRGLALWEDQERYDLIEYLIDQLEKL